MTYADYLINGALWFVIVIGVLAAFGAPLLVYSTERIWPLFAAIVLDSMVLSLAIASLAYRYDVGLA